MVIDELEPSPAGSEWVSYNDPVAKIISKSVGQVSLKGVGKINASLPDRFGEIEFESLETFVDYIEMPKRVKDLDQRLKTIEETLEMILGLIENQILQKNGEEEE
jgi:hypothetical protein